MLDLLFPYLIAILAFLVVVVVATASHHFAERARISYEEKQRQLPDFLRYTDFRAELDELELQLAEKREEASRAEALIAEAEQQRRWLAENEQTIRQVEQARAQLEEQESKLTSVIEQLSAKSEELRKVQEDRNKAEFEVLQLSDQLKFDTQRLEQVQKDTEEAKTRLATIQQRLEDAQVELDKRERQHAALTRDCDALVHQREALANEVQKLEGQRAEAESKLAATEQARQAAEAEHRRFAGLAEDEKARLERASHELDEVQKALVRDKQALEEAKRLIEERERELARMTRDQDALEAKRNELAKEIEEQIKACEQLDEALETLRRKEQELQKSIGIHEAKDAALQARVREAGGATIVDDPLEELRATVLTANSFTNESDAGELEALDSLALSLEERGLVFDRRVLNAFHTSLKSQNESPLLVLAGISGTGKSLLPQRYAEHMGIHSLLVPVQPRWDGPQDLLGFFNYLEGRYKPTELIRALVQFDPYLDLLPEDAQKLHDRMLLVILDEMNLARVEYYFSEFLSRLEARRELKNVKDADARRRASLGIECGLTSEGAQERHVFVDQNVLFVGTINEDESTQTLSDKVVDRANVMRFGRPKSEDSRPVAVAEDEPEDKRPFLSRAQWQSWITNARELTDEEVGEVRRCFTELNDALEMIGKPFGHRTRNAFLNYVRQYPGRNSKSFQWALADQIEQRVLPKLRGVDPSEGHVGEAIERVRAVADSLGDTVLTDAIEAGRSGGHGHTFLWHGVDRSQSGS